MDIPLIGYKHAYITTDRIPGIENMPNIRDHDASVYLKLQGDALHIGGYEHNPVLIEGVNLVIQAKYTMWNHFDTSSVTCFFTILLFLGSCERLCI